MKRLILPSRHVAALVFAGLALVACGGGSDYGDGLTDAQREDRAASASVAGLVDFAAGQIGRATDETSEPRPLTGITPPADDTAEPFVL